MEIQSFMDMANLIKKEDNEVVEYLQNLRLLKRTLYCKNRGCRRICTVRRKLDQNSLNSTYYCKRCRRDYSVFTGSFFEKVKIPIRAVLLLMWLWANETRSDTAVGLSGLSKKSVVQHYRFFRDIVSWKLLQEPDRFQLGGPGHVVQIDESVMTRRKYHRGRMVPAKWVIGIYDVTARRGYIQYIPGRAAADLIPIIQRVVRPGTEIWTDQWRGYNTLQHLGFEHHTVNHSRNFRDPITGVCTNHVEGYWSCLKQYLRRLGVMSSPFLPEYIDVFLWKSIYGRTNGERLASLTVHIAERYPV